MRINTNIASMTAQESASNVNKNLSSSLEKLSSGLRINKAADDASGMAIADKLRTQASSIGQSIENANSANALVQIADKAMAEQSNILDIIKTKLIQASTATTSDEGRDAIRKDILKLQDQLDNIADQTNYNGTKLLQKDEYLTDTDDTQSAKIDDTTANDAGTKQIIDIDAASAAFGNADNTMTLTLDGKTFIVGASGSTADTDASDNSTTAVVADDASATAIGTAMAGLINADADSDGVTDSGWTAVDNGDGSLTITANVAKADVTGITNVASGTSAPTAGTVTDDTATGAAPTAQVDTLTLANINAGDTIAFQIDGNDFTFTADQDYTAADAATAIATAINDNTTIGAIITADGSAGDGTVTLTADSAGTAFTVTDSAGAAVVYSSDVSDGSESQFATNADGTIATGNAIGTDALNFQIGELTTNDIKTSGGVNSNRAGLGLTDFAALTDENGVADVLTIATAEAEMAKVDAALNTLNGWRSDFGSTQNQLDSSIRNMMTTQTNIKAAESVIRDVDYAAESANFNKQNIIAQAGTYAMSQANAVQQNVMRLLQ